jgi:hypothetical protein
VGRVDPSRLLHVQASQNARTLQVRRGVGEGGGPCGARGARAGRAAMDPHQDGYDLGEGGRDPFFGFGSFDMYDTGGGSTGWGVGQGGGMHRGGQSQTGVVGGDVGEYRMHSRGAMPMGYRHPQYLNSHHVVHRGEPVPSQNPHVRPLHAQEYQRRVEVPVRHPEPRAQASQPPAPMPKLPPQQQLRQQHQQQKCMGQRAPATPTIAVAKRARDEPVLPLPSDGTSSKRSRAEKHYREIRLLCDALSPHIAHVQVAFPVCQCVCVCMYPCMYVFVYIYVCICMYVCTYVCLCMYTCTHKPA